MRFLYLTYGSQSGVIEYLGKSLAKQGVEISVFDTAGDLNYRSKRFKVPSLKFHNLVNTCIAVWKYKKDWKQHFKRTDFAFKFMTRAAQKYIEANINKFDLILQSGVLFSASFKDLNIPYCLYLDHTYAISKKYPRIDTLPDTKCASKTWEQLESEVYKKADIIFVMSEYVKSSLINDYGIVDDKIIVIGAGPNFSRVPERIQKEYNKRILFVGKDFKRKGGDILLKAFETVRRYEPDAGLIIVGPKEPVPAAGVVSKGSKDFKAMARLYNNSSVFVLPTLREPFGLAFLEAMSYQLPCIGTDIEAVPEIIDDGDTGFIVPAGDDKILADKIIKLLRDKQLAGRMGQAGYEKVKNYYNWDAVAGRIMGAIGRIGHIG